MGGTHVTSSRTMQNNLTNSKRPLSYTLCNVRLKLSMGEIAIHFSEDLPNLRNAKFFISRSLHAMMLQSCGYRAGRLQLCSLDMSLFQQDALVSPDINVPSSYFVDELFVKQQVFGLRDKYRRLVVDRLNDRFINRVDRVDRLSRLSRVFPRRRPIDTRQLTTSRSSIRIGLDPGSHWTRSYACGRSCSLGTTV